MWLLEHIHWTTAQFCVVLCFFPHLNIKYMSHLKYCISRLSPGTDVPEVVIHYITYGVFYYIVLFAGQFFIDEHQVNKGTSYFDPQCFHILQIILSDTEDAIQSTTGCSAIRSGYYGCFFWLFFFSRNCKGGYKLMLCSFCRNYTDLYAPIVIDDERHYASSEEPE